MRKSIRKKIMTVVVGAVLMISSAMTVMAATPSIAVDAPTTGGLTVTKEGSTFDAYQVLVATKQGDAYTYAAAQGYENFFMGQYSIENISKMAGNINTTVQSPSKVEPSAEMAALTVALQNYIKTNNLTKTQSLTSGIKSTGLGLGYYLVTDTTVATTGNASVASKAMMVAIPMVNTDNTAWIYDVSMYPKDDSTNLEKKIMDGSTPVDTSTASIGDTVNYRINAGIPTYDANAKNIMYQFTDTLSAGLTFKGAANTDIVVKTQDSTKIFAQGTDYTATVNGQTINIVFAYDNIKTYADKGISILYSATLNEKAVIGTTAGNPNTVKLDYTNNPTIQNDHKTIEDKVITFSFGLGIEKVDADSVAAGKPSQDKLDLAGAEFTIKDGTGKDMVVYTYNEVGKIVILSGAATTDAKGMIYVAGLKDGDYTITETKAPAGYSILADVVKVKITAEKSGSDYTGNATVTIINGNTAAAPTTNITMKDNNILLGVQIKNYSGFMLPGSTAW